MAAHNDRLTPISGDSHRHIFLITVNQGNQTGQCDKPLLPYKNTEPSYTPVALLTLPVTTPIMSSQE